MWSHSWWSSLKVDGRQLKKLIDQRVADVKRVEGARQKRKREANESQRALKGISWLSIVGKSIRHRSNGISDAIETGEDLEEHDHEHDALPDAREDDDEALPPTCFQLR
jgi:hypothetical protein